MFHLEALAERLPLPSIFQNMTFIFHVQRLVNVTKIAKFILPSILYEIYTVIIYMSRVVEIDSLTETGSNCDLGHHHAHTCYHCF